VRRARAAARPRGPEVARPAESAPCRAPCALRTGKGVPFYGLFTIPGKAERTKEDGAFAGSMFKWHKWAGGFLWYLVPLHVGGALQHSLRGHAIFSRMNPLATPK
jgi:cytochrome b561